MIEIKRSYAKNNKFEIMKLLQIIILLRRSAKQTFFVRVRLFKLYIYILFFSRPLGIDTTPSGYRRRSSNLFSELFGSGTYIIENNRFEKKNIYTLKSVLSYGCYTLERKLFMMTTAIIKRQIIDFFPLRINDGRKCVVLFVG